MNARDDHWGTPLHAAVGEGHVAVVDWLLADAGADVLLMPAAKGPPPRCLTDDEYRAFDSQMAMLRQPGFLAHYAYGMQLTQLRIPSLALPTRARHEDTGVPGPPPPAGLLIFGRVQDDMTVLRVAKALERALARAT